MLTVSSYITKNVLIYLAESKTVINSCIYFLATKKCQMLCGIYISVSKCFLNDQKLAEITE